MQRCKIDTPLDVPAGLLALASLLLTPAFAAGAPLDLDGRIECHRAIEGVYWQHRTWPANNPGVKPPLSAVLPEATLRARAEDSLKLSSALAERWSTPITAAMLQAELDRMARASRDPGRLAELFAALGDDPQRIAECLARPALAERLARDRYAFDPELHADLERRARALLDGVTGPAGLAAAAEVYEEVEWVRAGAEPPPAGAAPEPARVTLGEEGWNRELAGLAESLGTGGAAPPVAGAVGPLREDSDRFYAVAVLAAEPDRLRVAVAAWPKTPFGSWWSGRRDRFAAAAGDTSSAGFSLPVVAGGEGGSCEPDSWRATASLPTERSDHSAVWTGSEMIVFGGRLAEPRVIGAYDPATDRWRPLPRVGRPGQRTFQTAVWTGSEMVVWGGWAGDTTDNVLDDGGRYDPVADSWAPVTLTGAPQARMKHTAVWTGSEMVVWGGCESFACSGTNLNTGGRYDPRTDSWAPTAVANAPAGRADHSAVWTGDEMIVWGGCAGIFCDTVDGTGGRYDPALDSWTPVTTVDAPAARVRHTAVWTGSEMIVWGGCPDDFCFGPVDTGGRYDPATDSWDPTTTAGAPQGRRFHTAVWTGSQMIVWGGCVDGDCSDHRLTGGRYDPLADLWTPTPVTAAPAARSRHTAVWTGSEMVVWAGCSSGECQIDRNDGGRYSPAADAWTPIIDPQTPSRRWSHTAVWTGGEMIVWGGRDPLGRTLTGGRYDPATDTWTPTDIDGFAEARDFHTAVWSGTEMITWGGRVQGIGPSSSGNRYDPTTDSWSETSTAGAPAARYRQTAVWTGSEMIVWGGQDDVAAFATGGRYDPGTDSWSPTATAAAPAERRAHTAVWTGAEMIVWGGSDFSGSMHQSGGRYDPATDSWTPTSLTGAPAHRIEHTAVWTGTEMVVWGGAIPGVAPTDTGGVYDPAADAWTPTTTAGAPAQRFLHAAVWTGSEMVVWGGCRNGECRLFDRSGGRYDPGEDVWAPTAVAFAPPGRNRTTAVWTGERMIVWGGYRLPGVIETDTGGLYCAGTAVIFADGFESGDTSAWSSTTP